LLLKEPDNEFKALRSYYSTRILLKIKEMKMRLTYALKGKSIEEVAGPERAKTRKAFIKMASSESMRSTLLDAYSGRMQGLHSYNVLDSADFIETKKIENKIHAFDKKLRDKQIREAERARDAALTEAAAIKAQTQVGSPN